MDEAASIVAEQEYSLSGMKKRCRTTQSGKPMDGTYRIWLEDRQSLEEKLKVIKENGLAGVAEWSLGMEDSSVWDLILQYVN